MLLGLAFLTACGTSPEDEVARDAAYIAGQSAAALTMGASTGSDAAEAQDMREPRAPAGVADMSCVRITRIPMGLNVDFGASCEVGGHVYAGDYTIVISAMTGAMVSVVFDDFAVDGVVYAGDVSVGVAPGSVETDVDLTVDGTTQVQLDGQLVVANDAITIDGAGTYADAEHDVTIAANGLRSQVGGCYADAGNIVIVSQGAPTATVEFDGDTPSTGIVTVTVGRVTRQQTLPPTARCPR